MHKPQKKTFNLIGHNNIEKFMLDSIKSRRIHHAYLLSGIEGIGKATFAHRVSRFILSNLYGDNMEIEKNNRTVNLINNDSHPDFMVLSKDSHNEKNVIEIKQVRKCIEFFSHTPILSKFKICIIDSIDDMNINSANAILKILEEPPKNSLFFIIAHNKETVLPTIRSRCLSLPFKKFTDNEIKNFVSERVSEDKILNLDKIVKISNGSIGKALSLINEDFQDINSKVNNLFDTNFSRNSYSLEDFIDISDKIDLFFEIIICKIETLIKEIIQSNIQNERRQIEQYFNLRDHIHKIYFDGKKFNNLNNHMIMDVIFLIKETFDLRKINV